MAKTSSSNTKKPPAKKATGKKASAASSSSSSSSSKGTTKVGAKQIILDIAADSYSREETSVPKERFTQGTGLAIKTVVNNLAKLKAEGLVESQQDGTVRLTEKGVEHMGDKAKVPATLEERLERFQKKLKPKHIKMIDMLKDGKAHKKLEIAKKLDFESHKQKGFVNLIGTLSSLKLVEYPDKESVKLSGALIGK